MVVGMICKLRSKLWQYTLSSIIAALKNIGIEFKKKPRPDSTDILRILNQLSNTVQISDKIIDQH